MLLVTRTEHRSYFDARFVCPAAFVPCAGAVDPETAAKLVAAFRRPDTRSVKSLHHRTLPDETAWCAGNGWRLSTA